MNIKTTEPLITSAISRLSDMIGRATAWLSIVLMIVVSAIVLLRYGFDIGSVALQESAAYLHATFFMVGAAYTLKADDHVRVDIFYRNYSLIKKAWVNSIGSIVLLLPMCAFICLASIGLVSDSWLIKEGSGDTGGLSFVYLLKGLIPLMAILLALQAIADIFNNISLLSRHYGESY
jgi:TRAP-type mannitol/chloroaromatic compound transport system permease small subunit